MIGSQNGDIISLNGSIDNIKSTLSLRKQYATQGQYADIPFKIVGETGRSYLLIDIISQNGQSNKISISIENAKQTIIGYAQTYTNASVSYTSIAKINTGIRITFTDTAIWGAAIVTSSGGVALI